MFQAIKKFGEFRVERNWQQVYLGPISVLTSILLAIAVELEITSILLGQDHLVPPMRRLVLSWRLVWIHSTQNNMRSGFVCLVGVLMRARISPFSIT